MKRILCFGDSNTWGYRAGEATRMDENTRWPKVLQHELNKTIEAEVIEEGQNGRTTVFFDPVEERMAGIDYFYPCLMTHAPLDLVILMLGSNDLKNRFGVGPVAIARGFYRYRDALIKSHIRGPVPEVLLIAPPHVEPCVLEDPRFGPDMTHAPELSLGFADAYRKTAEELGWHFLDAALFAHASDVDGMHMTEESHRRLGKAVAEAVIDIF